MSLALNVTYDSSDSLFHYSNISGGPEGDWNTTKPNGIFYGGDSRLTDIVGAFISWRFYGVAFAIMGDRLEDHGTFQITIDNEAIGNYSGFADRSLGSSPLQVNQTLFASEVLDFDLHTVEYLNLGNQRAEEKGDYAVFDFLQVQVEDKDDATGTDLTSASGLVTAPADASSPSGPNSDSESIGPGAVAGAVVGAVVGAAVLALLGWSIVRKRRRNTSRHARSEIAEEPSPTFSPVALARSHRSDSEPLMSRSIGSTNEGMGAVRPFTQPAVAIPPPTNSSSQGSPSSQHSRGYCANPPALQTSGLVPATGDSDMPLTPQEAPPTYTQTNAAQSKGQFPSSTATSSSRFRGS